MAEKIPWTKEFCFHPDIAEAYRLYRQGDKDAFKRAVLAHHESAKQGLRITEGSEETDQYLIDLVEQLTFEYTQQTGDARPRVNLTEKKRGTKQHWTDIPLGIRGQDEE